MSWMHDCFSFVFSRCSNTNPPITEYVITIPVIPTCEKSPFKIFLHRSPDLPFFPSVSLSESGTQLSFLFPLFHASSSLVAIFTSQFGMIELCAVIGHHMLIDFSIVQLNTLLLYSVKPLYFNRAPSRKYRCTCCHAELVFTRNKSFLPFCLELLFMSSKL